MLPGVGFTGKMGLNSVTKQLVPPAALVPVSIVCQAGCNVSFAASTAGPDWFLSSPSGTYSSFQHCESEQLTVKLQVRAGVFFNPWLKYMMSSAIGFYCRALEHNQEQWQYLRVCVTSLANKSNKGNPFLSWANIILNREKETKKETFLPKSEISQGHNLPRLLFNMVVDVKWKRYKKRSQNILIYRWYDSYDKGL